MGELPDDIETFEEVWETLQLEETLEQTDETATIRPQTRPVEGVREFDVDRLRRLTGGATEELPEVELEGTIGEGGMGEIRLARQLPLGRDVAVKSIRHEDPGGERRRVLLQESWVTGILEHPNVVPIYTLGRSEADDPLIVMKNIEGVSWRRLLEDPEAAPREFDSDAPLDWHLEILSQICNALHYAHNKGIVHRDVKPENVMMGKFGEVYLLDWGVAVSLEAAEDHRLPSAEEVTTPAGTPAYMAPEMVRGVGDALRYTSDVYLLGAVLHEILTGEPPHAGESMYEVFEEAYHSEPHDYGDDVDPELASICRKAMHPDPDERHESAEAFRRALVHHMKHRDSLRMSREATQRLDDLKEAVEETGEDAQLYQAFGECRFGFEQALEISPDNEEARAGLQEVLEFMAERELDRGALEAASLLVADLPEPNERLERRLEELEAQLKDREDEYAELKQFQHEEDVDVDRRGRAMFAAFWGLVWGAFFIVFPEAVRWAGYALTPELYAWSSLSMGAMLVLAVGSIRGNLTWNRANRRFVGGLAVVVATGALLRVMGAALGLEVVETVALEQLAYGSGSGVLAAALDPRVAYAAIPFAVGAVVSALVPSWAFFGLASACVLSMSALALRWW